VNDGTGSGGASAPLPSPGGATPPPEVVRSERSTRLPRVGAPTVRTHGRRPGRAPRRARQPPKRVRDRLAAGERLLMQPLRQHPIVLLRPTAIVFAGLAFIYVVSSVVNLGSQLLGVLGFLWIILLLWGIIQWIEHYVDYIVVTQKRVVRISGIIPGVAMLPITRVTDFKYERGIVGALLGYGTFILESAGQVQALRELEYVREPNKVYEVITAAIYASE